LNGQSVYRSRRCAPVCARERVAHAHYEVVFVAVSEQRVVGCDFVDEIEGRAWQTHVVYVNEVESVPACVVAPVLLPLPFPCRAEN